MDETPNSWWEVRKPNSPFPNYFIVEDVGDPNDGDHLVSLLNEREQLIHENFDLRKQMDKLLGFVESETLLSALQSYESGIEFEVSELGGETDDVPDADDETDLAMWLRSYHDLESLYTLRREVLSGK